MYRRALVSSLLSGQPRGISTLYTLFHQTRMSHIACSKVHDPCIVPAAATADITSLPPSQHCQVPVALRMHVTPASSGASQRCSTQTTDRASGSCVTVLQKAHRPPG